MNTVVFDIRAWSATHLDSVDSSLDRWVCLQVPPGSNQEAPDQLLAAMRYAVLDGGKRLRPLLVMAAWEAAQCDQSTLLGEQQERCALDHEAALRTACAVELIHAYSLVHDDMPCMDNDVLRRGKPTVHVKFGEAGALLAGDALQALAFELLTPENAGMSPQCQAALCRVLARAAGASGMAGGQAIDLASVGIPLTESQLRNMHSLKTGAILQASVLMGAICGGASMHAQTALAAYGAAIGLAFQVVDDILDVTEDSATLGKTAGKDASADKPTYVSLLGLERARAYAHDLLGQALESLARSGLDNTRALQELAHMVVNRVS